MILASYVRTTKRRFFNLLHKSATNQHKKVRMYEEMFILIHVWWSCETSARLGLKISEKAVEDTSLLLLATNKNSCACQHKQFDLNLSKCLVSHSECGCLQLLFRTKEGAVSVTQTSSVRRRIWHVRSFFELFSTNKVLCFSNILEISKVGVNFFGFGAVAMADLSATELWVFSCSADLWPLAFSSWQVLAQHKVNVFSSAALRGSSYTVLGMYYP